MDKIYSRRRLNLPKLNISIFNKNNNSNKNDIYKIFKILVIILIAIITMNKMIKAITPIIDRQCKTNAKMIATKISNEQATVVMSNYNYDDLCNIIKDSNRKYCYDKCKCNNSKRNNIRCSNKNTRRIKQSRK